MGTPFNTNIYVKGGFINQFTAQERRFEATRVIMKYPDRIPIICESSAPNVPKLDKIKYLVPRDFTAGQFMYVIRKRLVIPPEKAIFLFVDNLLPSSSSPLGKLYDVHANEDGFLYIKYSFENTFG